MRACVCMRARGWGAQGGSNTTDKIATAMRGIAIQASTALYLLHSQSSKSSTAQMRLKLHLLAREGGHGGVDACMQRCRGRRLKHQLDASTRCGRLGDSLQGKQQTTCGSAKDAPKAACVLGACTMCPPKSSWCSFAGSGTQHAASRHVVHAQSHTAVHQKAIAHCPPSHPQLMPKHSQSDSPRAAGPH